MTVRLIKQNEKPDSSRKAVTAAASPNQVLLTTQGWVQEFKARKAKGHETIAILSKRS